MNLNSPDSSYGPLEPRINNQPQSNLKSVASCGGVPKNFTWPLHFILSCYKFDIFGISTEMVLVLIFSCLFYINFFAMIFLRVYGQGWVMISDTLHFIASIWSHHWMIYFLYSGGLTELCEKCTWLQSYSNQVKIDKWIRRTTRLIVIYPLIGLSFWIIQLPTWISGRNYNGSFGICYAFAATLNSVSWYGAPLLLIFVGSFFCFIHVNWQSDIRRKVVQKRCSIPRAVAHWREANKHLEMVCTRFNTCMAGTLVLYFCILFILCYELIVQDGSDYASLTLEEEIRVTLQNCILVFKIFIFLWIGAGTTASVVKTRRIIQDEMFSNAFEELGKVSEKITIVHKDEMAVEWMYREVYGFTIIGLPIDDKFVLKVAFVLMSMCSFFVRSLISN